MRKHIKMTQDLEGRDPIPVRMNEECKNESCGSYRDPNINAKEKCTVH